MTPKALFLLGSFLLPLAVAQAQTPPPQPTSGPGNSQVVCSRVISHSYGEGSSQYWIFEPDSPRPKSAPVIVFSHGWTAMDPAIYGAWLDHLVKRGNIVIYPRYQANIATPPTDFTPYALTAVKAALARLQREPGHVKPDTSRFALVGHSVGGLLTANLAALAKANGLPTPRAVMCVQPGRTWGPVERVRVTLEDLKKIPATALLLTIVGDRDTVVGETDAKRIFNETPQIPRANKDYVMLQTDTHGHPTMMAGHLAPAARDDDYSAALIPAGNSQATGQNFSRFRTQPGASVYMNGIDALDFYGTWKLFDALCDAAFYGTNRQYALGNTPQQRYMGRWSDGQPLKELKVTDSPGTSKAQ